MRNGATPIKRDREQALQPRAVTALSDGTNPL
jgi:hypothetical protein